MPTSVWRDYIRHHNPPVTMHSIGKCIILFFPFMYSESQKEKNSKDLTTDQKPKLCTIPDTVGFQAGI